MIYETAPPGKKAEEWIKSNKSRFHDQYGEERGNQILYATAWKLYGKKESMNESDDYKTWKAHSEKLDQMQRDHSKKMKSYSREGGRFGMPPEHIRRSPEYQQDRAHSEQIQQAIRKHNEYGLKRFKTEIKQQRDAERAARMSKVSEEAPPANAMGSSESGTGNIDMPTPYLGTGKIKNEKLLRRLMAMLTGKGK